VPLPVFPSHPRAEESAGPVLWRRLPRRPPRRGRRRSDPRRREVLIVRVEAIEQSRSRDWPEEPRPIGLGPCETDSLAFGVGGLKCLETDRATNESGSLYETGSV